MQYSGAQVIVTMLERQGVTVVSGIPGGANLPLYDALSGSSIRHVLAAHEQGAGFIAQGMARSSGRPAVCLASSGPGVLNLLTALADAMADSIPLVAITGQVARGLIGTDAFQEVDAFTLSMPITKQSWLVQDAAELPELIPQAFHLAGSGRQGPVLIDVPKDVFLQMVELDEWPKASEPLAAEEIDQSLVEQAANMINHAQRPVIYAGGGLIAAWRKARVNDPCAMLAELAHRSTIPVALSFMGLGAFPASDPLYLGMLGMHAAPATNLAMDQADLIIALGVRFDDRATGRLDAFCPDARVIHVDIDAAELGKLRQAELAIAADVATFLAQILPFIRQDGRIAWQTELKAMQRAYPMPKVPGVNPAKLPSLSSRKRQRLAEGDSAGNPFGVLELLELIQQQAGPDAIITTDVGQHQMWVAQHYPFERPGCLLSSGGMGTMGFGLPAAIGAAIQSGRRVICLSGDGSILMNIQELGTLGELGLPVTVVVFNNGHLGLVRQQQHLFYGQRYHASRLGANTDLAAVARGFGIPALGPIQRHEYMSLAEALAKADGPQLLDVCIDSAAVVLPMVAAGQPNRSIAGPWPLPRKGHALSIQLSDQYLVEA